MLINKAVSADAIEKEDYLLGCFTRPWDSWELETALDGIAKAGFKYCGLMTVKSGVVISPATTAAARNKILNIAKERGLKIVSVYADFTSGTPKEKWNDSIKKLVDTVAVLGSKYLMFGGTGDPKVFDLYYNSIASCCDYAESRNVCLTIKPHGGLNATGAQCRKIIETVNHRNFRLWYDPGNIFYYSDGKIDPVSDVDDVRDIVVGISVKDYLPPKNVYVTPGKGQVNFPKVFEKLNLLGFKSGPVLIECLEKGDFDYITAQAEQSKTYLENILLRLKK